MAQKDWGSLNNYVNAPFNLLPQALEVIENKQATATVIAPLWDGQVCFKN